MPRYASTLREFQQNLQNMLQEMGAASSQQERFFAYWENTGDIRPYFETLAECLEQPTALFLKSLNAKFHTPLIRPDPHNLNENVAILASCMGLGEMNLNGWIPIQKIGVGLVLAHFIPTATKPPLHPYLASFAVIAPQDYIAISQKWTAAQLTKLEELYPPKDIFLKAFEAKDLPQVLLADPEIEPSAIKKINQLSPDAEMAFGQYNGVLPEPYESWNLSRDSAMGHVNALFSLDNLDFLPTFDSLALKFNANELDFAPFKGADTEWIRTCKVLPLFVSENYVLMGGPTADSTETQQIVITQLKGWECTFARIPGKSYLQLLTLWNINQPIQLHAADAEALPIIPFEGNLQIRVGENEAAKDSAWVKDFVGSVIGQAIEKGASDVHIEPVGEEFRIRYRLDGRLQQLNDSFHVSFVPYVINRIKTMAEMDVSEHRMGQDGRMKVNYSGRTIDIRIATCPVENGKVIDDVNETATLRILDPYNYPSNLESIVDDSHLLQQIRKASFAPSGILIVTGPTGSGKSTTLYTIISELNSEESNIITLEDPVERRILGVNQTGIKKPNTFADSLRVALRRDPDVILVGEVRDSETAELIVKASRTGHLVFTSLHTDSSIGALQRLRGLGIAESEMADALQLITGQRLIRKLCMSCRAKRDLSHREIQSFSEYSVHSDLVQQQQCYESQGCSFCNGTGYKGRFAVTEVLPMTEDIKAYLEGASKFNAYELYNIAVEADFIPLYQHALNRVAQGLTDFKEIIAKVPESKATLRSRSKFIS